MESVLQTLSLERLFDLGQQLDVALPQGTAVEPPIRALLDSPDGGFERIVGLLRRDEIKRACEAHGLHVKGRLRADLLAKLKSATDTVTVADRTRVRGKVQIPVAGDVVALRRRQYLVDHVHRPQNPEHDTLVSLVGLDDDNQGHKLQVFGS